ncbi:hypothetical protein [Pedobacter sp. JY14-1]|uniref:TIR domain-containing protein n=1 Tax=Pedobacter sp. JY14-1 TaxID=3034151 RepID=UPI0023E0A9B0|nr:hypothetical protein [Pedobacter sp. JY14-1]
MKRIFVAFAIEDQTEKFLFTGQAKNDAVPFEFVDMSVKTPWDSAWKTNCRTRIAGCHGTIVLVSPNLRHAEGALWEVKCALDLGLPVKGVFIKGANYLSIPAEMAGKVDCCSWNHQELARFVKSL